MYWFSQAYVTNKQKAKTVSETLWERFISQYGWPERILTDQGGSFEAKLFDKLCKESKIEKIRTCPYRPQGNGQVERFNKALLNMIGTLNLKEKIDWTGKIQPLTHAYNCTSSQATGYSPFFLFYGRKPRIPLDVEFGLPDKRGQQPISEFVKQIKQTLEHAYKIAKETSTDEMGRYKNYFDQKHKCMKIEPGDLVMVRIKVFGNDYKVVDKWESVPYQVLSQNG